MSLSASVLALAAVSVAEAQAQVATQQQPAETAEGQAADEEIVVTGIRNSLERAAEIKQDAVQVLDSIVAQDIGKFPDPTTAAALQRVPGVQVQTDNNNELSGVRIRGLTDITTSVDGREVFTTTGRNFDLQDLSADALARVDVFKSQTADMIEGGVAGAIDLKLNKPFGFRDPTIMLSARSSYGVQVEAFNPQFGALATDRWDTGIGEIGVLVNANWSSSDSLRTITNLTDRRDSAASPLATPGYFLPNVLQNVTNSGHQERTQANAALQWQPTPELEVYVDGLYTRFESTNDDYGFNVQPFTTNVRVTDIVANSNCFDVRATGAGQNPTVSTNASGDPVLQPNTVKTLCDVDRATFLNAVANQTTGSQNLTQTNKLVAGGVRFDDGTGSKINLDIAYQRSNSETANIRTAVGQRIPTLILETNVDGGSRITVPGDYLLRTDTLSLRNQLIQNFNEAEGDLFQARIDGEQEIGGILPRVKVGLRYAKRQATFVGVQSNTPIPFGNIGTGSEARAMLVSRSGLPSTFLGLSEAQPHLNDGGRFFGPSGDFLRSEEGRDALRAVYGIAPGQPAYDPLRQFEATETTLASYVQGEYSIPLGTDLEIDGVVGVRVSKTDRDLDTFAAANTPVRSHISDTDVLPNATARLKLPGGFQARLSYSKAIRRPDFTALNPALSLVIDVNPAVLSTGSAGNPNLRPQKSNSFDATLEHYWKNGFVAVTGYYRTITDRVITAGSPEVINGTTYIVSRPRNIGQAKLQGIEASGQYFLDFLPGALNALGVLAAFTYADSEVQGSDSLAGNPLQGVSKYNFTVGALYDKGGLSGRLVYTYRSTYYNEDLSGQVQVRAFDPARVGEAYVPTLLEYVRPAGRLDFSIGYDINDRLRIDLGGTNILRTPTRTYRGESFFTGNYFDDETTYTAGIRLRI
jgi:TonB-dependent receptor